MKKIHLKGIDVRSAVKVLLPFYLFTFLPLNAHDWEDQSILQFNREPARADFHHAGEISLNGEWKFNWTLTPPTSTIVRGKPSPCLPTGR